MHSAAGDEDGRVSVDAVLRLRRRESRGATIVRWCPLSLYSHPLMIRKTKAQRSVSASPTTIRFLFRFWAASTDSAIVRLLKISTSVLIAAACLAQGPGACSAKEIVRPAAEDNVASEDRHEKHDFAGEKEPDAHLARRRGVAVDEEGIRGVILGGISRIDRGFGHVGGSGKTANSEKAIFFAPHSSFFTLHLPIAPTSQTQNLPSPSRPGRR